VSSKIKSLSNVEDLILIVLYAANGKSKGKLWLQKEIFELSKLCEIEELEFKAYDYGPYSESIQNYIDSLQNSEYIKDLELTENGKKIASELWNNINNEEKTLIKEIVNFFESLEKDELLLYIYVKSPAMAEKSEVKDKILKNRVKIALDMLKNEKISIGLAAKLAGLNIEEIKKEAIGIKPFVAE